MTHVTTPPRRKRRLVTLMSPPSCASIAVGVALVLGPACALAEVQVHGTPEATRLKVQGDSIDEVLAALGKAFDLRWRTPSPLDKPLTGTYEGSLNRVLARVLEGYNFVLKASDGRIEITVLGARGGTAVAGAGAPSVGTPAAASRPAAPWPPAVKANPAPPSPPSAPVLAAAATRTVGDPPAAPVPTPMTSTKVTEGPGGVGPVPQSGWTITTPEPVPSTVRPPMPGYEMGAGPVPMPSTVQPPMPFGAEQPSDRPPAPPKT
jgi:hypothetical protein